MPIIKDHDKHEYDQNGKEVIKASQQYIAAKYVMRIYPTTHGSIVVFETGQTIEVPENVASLVAQLGLD